MAWLIRRGPFLRYRRDTNTQQHRETKELPSPAHVPSADVTLRDAKRRDVTSGDATPGRDPVGEPGLRRRRLSPSVGATLRRRHVTSARPTELAVTPVT